MARGARQRRSLASNKHTDRGNDSKEGVTEESTFVFDQSLVTLKQHHSALVIERHYLAYREAVRTYHNKLSWARESHEKFSELLHHLTGENISRYIYKMCWPSEHQTMMKSIKRTLLDDSLTFEEKHRRNIVHEVKYQKALPDMIRLIKQRGWYDEKLLNKEHENNALKEILQMTKRGVEREKKRKERHRVAIKLLVKENQELKARIEELEKKVSSVDDNQVDTQVLKENQELKARIEELEKKVSSVDDNQVDTQVHTEDAKMPSVQDQVKMPPIDKQAQIEEEKILSVDNHTQETVDNQSKTQEQVPESVPVNNNFHYHPHLQYQSNVFHNYNPGMNVYNYNVQTFYNHMYASSYPQYPTASCQHTKCVSNQDGLLVSSVQGTRKRKCVVCEKYGCPGSNNRNNCVNKCMRK